MAINVRCLKCKSEFKLGVRKCPTCDASLRDSKRYKVKLSLPGGGWFTKTVDTLEVARNLESKVRSEIVDGQYFKYKASLKLKEVWRHYSQWAAGNKRSARDDLSRYERHIRPYLENHSLNKITSRDVEALLDRMRDSQTPRGKKYAPATVKQVHVLLKRIFNWARDRDYYHGPNPCDRIKLPYFDNRTTNALSAQDMDKLITALNSWKNERAALVIKFAIYTGRRRGEILALKWSDVDFASQLVTFQGQTSKNRHTQTLPVNNLAMKVLRRARDLKKSEFVFPASTGKYYHSLDATWQRFRKRNGLRQYRFHDLRHTFATYLINTEGVDLYKLQTLLGQKSPEMTKRYASLGDKSLRRVSAYLETLVKDYSVKSWEDLSELPKDILELAIKQILEYQYEDDGF